MQEKQERLWKIQEQIRDACLKAGRAESEVRLLAVSKTKGWEDVRDFALLGVKDFGENYVQEALAKAEALAQWEKSEGCSDPVRWHFIGNLQSNKAKFIPGIFSLFQALDSLSVAQKLDRAASTKGLVQECLVEVNIDHESTKGGLQPDIVPKFLDEIRGLQGIRVLGLMCIPEPREGRSLREPFAKLRGLLDSLNSSGAYSFPMRELSMGMSGDFQEAILEGSTIVRIGTSLFGAR